MMSILPGNNWTEVFYNVIIIYLFLTLLFTAYSLGRMSFIEHRACDRKGGKAHISKLIKEGKFVQMPVYTMEQIQADKHLEDVRLMFFPNDKAEKSKFILLLPGGGYGHCVTYDDAYPTAAALNEMGYSAFVLEYRVGRNCTPFGPMEDVGNALKLIEDNQEKFNITMEDYALMGFSAGGNLATIFASHKYGYLDYQLPKPKTVILAYPWTSVNDSLHHPYWNIWIGLIGVWLSLRGNIHMFGLKYKKIAKGALDAARYIEDDYPPTYMWSGSWDILVPASRHADVMESALKSHGVTYKYQKFFGLPHGIGLAKHTNAEGWLAEAIEFWQQQIQ